MPRSKGFTLLEVLLAVVLFGAGFVALLQAVGLALFSGSVNENEIIAVNLIQEKMEEARNTNYAGLFTEDPPSEVNGFPGFTRGMTVRTVQTGIKEAVVNVYWYVKNDRINMNAATYVSE